MKVRELIELLQKCNPNDSVMYDIGNSLRNEAYVVTGIETSLPIDDVLVGNGTLKGFVYLTEDLLEEDE